ncbi:phosphonate ABC transporter, permease protein PhnE [Halovenus sp. WSH3]|uniref:Phosphonate ABC transporter, permease protein PhnE n=1 Tax=Halovenus carboxidivorans TaxID=2692199 RepID=A0A6B0SZ80_9EURY|nr:phosphonate ABC transporter, permease protein PhnE [Halovenus carboxidivorans]MXR50765.1 phosphonate ABC transporter, permease protein PhnE [Halovenus carboxidivorans]
MSNVEPDESSYEEKYNLLRRRRLFRQISSLLLLFGIVALTVLGLRYIEFNPGDLWRQRGAFTQFLGNFFPPNFREFTLYTKQNDINGPKAITRSFRNFGAPIVETLTSDQPAAQTTLVRMSLVTLILGFTGTVIGFPLALLFGVLGSERVTPFPFNFIFRGTMSAIRSIPALVWIFIYIPLAGINPVGAVLAISTDTVGNMGRLFTDELEEIEEGPIEAIKSTGASRTQVVTFGMLSQVSTSFIAWALYVLEINVRIAIGLGVVGAGGIGRYITLRKDLFAYQEMAAGIVMVFFIVISVEIISSRIRARLRPSEHDSRGLLEVIKGLGDVNRWLGREPKN